MSHRYAAQHELLDDIVAGPLTELAQKGLQRYFDASVPPSQQFRGRHFDTYDGHGDNPATANTITPGDVLSLSFLSVPDLAPVAQHFEEHAQQATELLTQIPNKAIYDVEQSVIGDDSPAAELWELARNSGKNRTVTAYKLLARKRPALLPVSDTEIRSLLGPEVWDCMWHWFNDAPLTRKKAAEDLRAATPDIGHVSLLRCLDVPLWMLGRGYIQPPEGYAIPTRDSR